MVRKKPKYDPIVIPRKKWSERWEWFDMLKGKSRVSAGHRRFWQERGVKKLTGWIVINDHGEFLPTTFSVDKKSAKKKCLEAPLQKFSALISSFWGDWEKVGYKVVKVTMVEK